MNSCYSIVRYIADRARNEPINIGLILRYENQYFFDFSKESVERATTIDPNADESSLESIDEIIDGILSNPIYFWDDQENDSVEIFPEDEDFLGSLARESSNKILFSEPRSIIIESEESVDNAISMLLTRLVSPLKERPRFAPKESKARKTFRQELNPWIKHGDVHVDMTLYGKSGISREVDFFFENGSKNFVKKLDLNNRKESTIIQKAESQAYAVEDTRRIIGDKTLNPYIICDFSEDRAEDSVTTVKKIFQVVDCIAYDTSKELHHAIADVKRHLPELE